MSAAHPVAVKLDPDMRSRIKVLADARDRSTHWLLREAITQYVEREEQRESLRQDALRAWETYQATGRHLSHHEADEWLAELEDGRDVDPPECHG